MNRWFKKLLNLTRLQALVIFAGLGMFILVGMVVANSVKKTASPDESFLFYNESKADFSTKQDFSLKIEQDDDAQLKILDASVKTISGDQFRSLTSEKTDMEEVTSTPRITLQNSSEKVITGITVIVNDKGANTNRGLYIHDQAISPGEIFTILPDNFVKANENPAKDPKFWLSTKDRSQVVIRVSATFKDGTQWFNKNYGL